MADGVKLIFKEELIPAQADKLIFILAPIITAVPAWIILAVVPLGTIQLFGRTIDMSICREPERWHPVYRLGHFDFSVWHCAGGLVIQ